MTSHRRLYVVFFTSCAHWVCSSVLHVIFNYISESVISANEVIIILVGTCALLIPLTIVGVCQKVRGSKAKTGSNKVANVLETKKGPAKIGKELEKKTVLA